MDVDTVVVVGGGLAGLHTVMALRQRGYRGRLVLLGVETRPPYDRPPLSKAVLMGLANDSTLDADWAALGVDLLLGRKATGLAEGGIETNAGPVPFDRLVVATGARPRLLPGMPAGHGGSPYVLRTLDDALAIRAGLRPGARVVIVGAGWIGAEVATAAARAGCRVSVLEAGPVPVPGALPPDVGAKTASWYAEAGVDLRLETPVDEVGAAGVRLRGGDRVSADLVVVGIGVVPDTGWLDGSAVKRAPDGAVLVDAGLRASTDGVYAVGDCMAWDSQRFATRLRVEHWDNALRAPSVVAANLLGGDEVYDPVPYFWSEQFGRMIQYAGHHPAGETLVFRGDPDGPTWSACWLREERLVAVLTVDRPRDLVQGRRLIERRSRLDAVRLADPGVALRDCVT